MPKKRNIPHLLWRGKNWHAVLEIPADLRAHFGKRRFMATCGTDSQAIAGRRAAKYVAAWKAEITKARGAPTETDDAAFWRQRLLKAGDNKQRQLVLDRIEDEATDLASIHHEPGQRWPSGVPEAQEFFAKATGQIVPFNEHMDEWLATSQTTPKTKSMMRSDVARFADKFSMVRDVTRPEVRRWVSALIEGGLTIRTARRQLSALRGYWRYLQTIGVADENLDPFDNLRLGRPGKNGTERQPFTAADVVRLLNAAVAKGDSQLTDLIRLAMWTGCRIAELCSLRVEHVHDSYITVVDAKSPAGNRDVPIHAELVSVFARLIENVEGGYVLPGLAMGQYGNRSDGISKRFTALKRAEGFGPQFVFHSIRKTVATQLENAGVPEGIAADILGHEKATITYGLYSGGASLAVKAEALAKLKY